MFIIKVINFHISIQVINLHTSIIDTIILTALNILCITKIENYFINVSTRKGVILNIIFESSIRFLFDYYIYYLSYPI